MRHFLLVTADRRAMHPFDLKDITGRIRIGMMKPNAALSRHELELDEPTYLKHAKAIALACRIPGNTVYILSVREDEEKTDGMDGIKEIGQDPFEERETSRIPATSLTAAEMVAVSETAGFFVLQKIAREEGVDQWKSFTSRKALCAAILKKRTVTKPELHQAFSA